MFSSSFSPFRTKLLGSPSPSPFVGMERVGDDPLVKAVATLKEDPKNPDALLVVGFYLLLDKDLGISPWTIFQEVLQLQPNNSSAQHGLGVLRDQKNIVHPTRPPSLDDVMREVFTMSQKIQDNRERRQRVVAQGAGAQHALRRAAADLSRSLASLRPSAFDLPPHRYTRRRGVSYEDLLAASRDHLASGRWEDATALYFELHSHDLDRPGIADERFLDALDDLAEGCFQAALERAQEFRMSSQMRLAADAIFLAYAIDPGDPAVQTEMDQQTAIHSSLARKLIGQGRKEEAQGACDSAWEIDPRKAVAWKILRDEIGAA